MRSPLEIKSYENKCPNSPIRSRHDDSGASGPPHARPRVRNGGYLARRGFGMSLSAATQSLSGSLGGWPIATEPGPVTSPTLPS